MRKTIVALISGGSVLFLASTAFADNYFKIKGGLHMPEESLLDDGLNIEAAYGIDLGIDNLALELGLGVYTAGVTKSETYYDWWGDLVKEKAKVDLTVIPITANVIYSLNFDSPFSLYGGGGLGFYYATAELKYSYSEPYNNFGYSVKGDESEFNIGFNLVAGASFELNDQIDLIAEFKYVNAGDIEGLDIGGTFINAGLKFNF